MKSHNIHIYWRAMDNEDNFGQNNNRKAQESTSIGDEDDALNGE